MKALKIVGAVLLVAVGVVLVAAALKPSEYLVARELEILAKPSAVFPHLNDCKKTDGWMPWAEMDPAMKMTYEGPKQGVGAISKWDSTGGMGTGRAEVIESVPNQKVRTKITYEKPMKMEQVSEMTLTPTAKGTKVRWQVTGNNSYLGRVMCLFTDMDKMVGGMFEKGLGKLKATVESKASSPH